MFLFKSAAHIAEHIHQKKREGLSIGFVPTMGALHDGHLSLIQAAKQKNCYTICSIYVNPTQFNNAQDFEKYPSTIDADVLKLADSGCDVVFLPSTHEMYGDQALAQTFDYGSITNNFEGALRPGHFDGVITIVGKFFTMIAPNEVFFGQKDLQQCMVVSHLIKTTFPQVNMHLVPTQREDDGLAMSSRNVRLTIEQREVALALSKAIFEVKKLVKSGTDVQTAIAQAKQTHLAAPILKLEYLALVDAETMEETNIYEPITKQAVIIACWCAEVRLIDNVLLMD